MDSQKFNIENCYILAQILRIKKIQIYLKSRYTMIVMIVIYDCSYMHSNCGHQNQTGYIFVISMIRGALQRVCLMICHTVRVEVIQRTYGHN